MSFYSATRNCHSVFCSTKCYPNGKSLLKYLTRKCPEVSYNEYETLFLSYTSGMIARECRFKLVLFHFCQMVSELVSMNIKSWQKMHITN